jgi:hypothetical protein
MDDHMFGFWENMLIDEECDWKQVGISNDYCNTISEPKYGLKIINWNDKIFEVTCEKKFVFFLLRYT